MGVVFLSDISENNAEIIWFNWNFVHIITGTRPLKRQPLKKLAVLCLRHEVLKFILSHRSNSLRFEICPSNSWLMIPKSCPESEYSSTQRKEYSEGLHPFFVGYYPIRFYGLQDGRDFDWLIFKTCNSDLTTAPPGCLWNLQYVLWMWSESA